MPTYIPFVMAFIFAAVNMKGIAPPSSNAYGDFPSGHPYHMTKYLFGDSMELGRGPSRLRVPMSTVNLLYRLGSVISNIHRGINVNTCNRLFQSSGEFRIMKAFMPMTIIEILFDSAPIVMASIISLAVEERALALAVSLPTLQPLYSLNP